MMGPAKRVWNLLRRNGPIEASRKIMRYLEWQVVAQVQRWRILRMPDNEARFTHIYKVNFWAAKESRSGPGSSLNDTTELRRRLPELFRQFSIGTVFDAPCGDFNWMQAVVAAEPIRYIGGDIVRPMIEENQRRHGSDRVTFRHHDITRDPLPQADLWICRDCLYHLSIEDIRRALQRFVESNVPYLLASTHRVVNGPANIEIASGDFRFTDLFAAPFLLPRDTLFRIEDNAYSDMRLWSREQVAASPFVQAKTSPPVA
ncbi:MAG: class I SAM-dependent methyltransferase [Proteobacteria bacterium]|nr:class I SAM-dependent methyltransferase [Pseudomonadota bacterium]